MDGGKQRNNGWLCGGKDEGPEDFEDKLKGGEVLPKTIERRRGRIQDPRCLDIYGNLMLSSFFDDYSKWLCDTRQRVQKEGNNKLGGDTAQT